MQFTTSTYVKERIVTNIIHKLRIYTDIEKDRKTYAAKTDNRLDSYNILIHTALCLYVRISHTKLPPNIILVRYSWSSTVTQMYRALNLMETNCRTWEGNAETRDKAIRLYQANCRTLVAHEWEDYENLKTQRKGSNFPNSPGRRLL